MFQKINTEFKLRGQAKHTQLEMTNKIKEMIKHHYGINCNIGGNDWSRYYRQDGAKITKTLTSILRKNLDKKEVERKFPQFAKDISELYHPSADLFAYFGDKLNLGEGVYETGPTCIAEGHQNQGTKRFVGQYKRTQMLCIEHRSQKRPSTGRSRCIAYFAGGRNIFLTNFYYNGMQNNRLIFVEAVRRMFNWDKVIWKTNETFFLPIYRNGETIQVHPADRFRDHYDVKRMIPCPNCKKKIPESDYYYEERGHTRYMGCSKLCAEKASGMMRECLLCNQTGNRERMHAFRGAFACTGCFTSATAACAGCGNRFLREEGTMTADDIFKCPRCIKSSHICFLCKKYYHRTVTMTADRDLEGRSKKICYPCVEERKRKCQSCGCVFSFSLSRIVLRGKKMVVCDNCARALGAKPRIQEEEIIELELPDEISQTQSSSDWTFRTSRVSAQEEVADG